MKDIFQKLRRHWLISLLGFFGLLLLLISGYVSVSRYSLSTPIAHIEPKDSLEAITKQSKLDRYKKEIEQQEKQAHQRKRALDEIIAMDFSKHNGSLSTTGKSTLKKKLSGQIAGQRDTLPEKSREVSIAAYPSKPVGRKHKSVSKPLNKEVEVNQFYTIRVEESERPALSQPDTQTYYKALIFGNQKLQVNGRVRIRLEQNMLVNGKSFPQNTILTGRVTSQTSSRVKINIAQIEGLRINLKVHDQDYQEGVVYQTKEVITEVANEAKNEAVDEILSSLPYGGIAGGLAKLGKSTARRTRKSLPLFLADGYQIYLTFSN